MFDYKAAHPNEANLCEYLDEANFNWEEIAKSRMGFMSDDDVGDWARINGFWSEEEE